MQRFYSQRKLALATAPALLLLCLATACSNPCESLRRRAEGCGHTVASTQDEQNGTCYTLLQTSENEIESFDACVSASSCGDNEALAACTQDYLGEDKQDACLEFQLWASACGLSPQGTENDCESLKAGTSGLGSNSDDGFQNWVSCVSAEGCLKDQDDRLLRCQASSSLGDDSPIEVLTACGDYAAWQGDCGIDLGGGQAPGDSANLLACLTQSTQFTSASFSVYTKCLVGGECTDFLSQFQCAAELERVETDESDNACGELEDYASECADNVPNEIFLGCSVLVSRLDAQTIGNYVTCLRAFECGDTNASSCGALIFNN